MGGKQDNESECSAEPSGSADYHTEPEGSALHAATGRRGSGGADFFKARGRKTAAQPPSRPELPAGSTLTPEPTLQLERRVKRA